MIRRVLLSQEHPAKLLRGEVEADESYFGGRRKGKRGHGAAGKVPVLGILEQEKIGSELEKRRQRISTNLEKWSRAAYQYFTVCGYTDPEMWPNNKVGPMVDHVWGIISIFEGKNPPNLLAAPRNPRKPRRAGNPWTLTPIIKETKKELSRIGVSQKHHKELLIAIGLLPYSDPFR